MNKPVSEALTDATRTLAAAGVDDPAGDAFRLLTHIAEPEPGSSIPGLFGVLDNETRALFDGAVNRRKLRCPVSQIVGKREFYGIEFKVNSSVLDPRPDSECLVEQAILRNPRRILDLGTGSGCLLLSILHSLPNAYGVGVDISQNAISLAEANAEFLGLADRAKFTKSNWLSSVHGTFDLIVANPPYVTFEEYQSLEPEVQCWEPREALTDGFNGLLSYVQIAKWVGRHLSKENGCIMLETAAGKTGRVAGIFELHGFDLLSIENDIDGRDRVVILRQSDEFEQKRQKKFDFRFI